MSPSEGQRLNTKLRTSNGVEAVFLFCGVCSFLLPWVVQFLVSPKAVDVRSAYEIFVTWKKRGGETGERGKRGEVGTCQTKEPPEDIQEPVSCWFISFSKIFVSFVFFYTPLSPASHMGFIVKHRHQKAVYFLPLPNHEIYYFDWEQKLCNTGYQKILKEVYSDSLSMRWRNRIHCAL